MRQKPIATAKPSFDRRRSSQSEVGASRASTNTSSDSPGTHESVPPETSRSSIDLTTGRKNKAKEIAKGVKRRSLQFLKTQQKSDLNPERLSLKTSKSSGHSSQASLHLAPERRAFTSRPSSFRHEHYRPVMESDADEEARQALLTAKVEVTQQVIVPPLADLYDIKVPPQLHEGTQLLKCSAKNKSPKLRRFRLDPDLGQIQWESKSGGTIQIDHIKEVRTGEDTVWGTQATNPLSISIIYTLPVTGKYKVLNVLALSQESYTMWTTALRSLHSLRQALSGNVNMDESDSRSGSMLSRQRDSLWERQYWRDTDRSGDERADFREIQSMCRRLGVRANSAELLNVFMAADSSGKGSLDFSDFKHFVTLLRSRTDIQALYEHIRNNSDFTLEVFKRFMRIQQRSSIEDEDLATVFQTFATRVSDIHSSQSAKSSQSDKTTYVGRTDTAPKAGENTASNPTPGSSGDSSDMFSMSLLDFTSFLLSSHNSAISRDKSSMDHPLSEYYISSSHNTYLIGNQLMGDSTVEGYIRALLQGCRSVELDVWDGEGQPAIYHGRTLTTKVPLTDVARAIARYAFITSPYPVIISAEIHCSIPQQDQAAEIFRSEFGDLLVKDTLDGKSEIFELPSPNQLRHRILLKAKNLFASQDEEAPSADPGSSTSDTEASTDGSDRDIAAKGLQKAKALLRRAKESLGTEAESLGKRSSAKPEGSKTRPDASINQTKTAPPQDVDSTSRTAIDKPKKMSLGLAALIVYTVGVKCRGFNKNQQYAIEHVFSLSERTANKILTSRDDALALAKHNRNHLARIYPNGTRLGSSNYEPHKYWATGTQLVAINCQTYDTGYIINSAMFQRNDRCGYVLKPQHLRAPFDSGEAKYSKHCLNVTIISAQQLPRPDFDNIDDDHGVDPYVEISLHIPEWPLHISSADQRRREVQPVDRPISEKSSSESGATRTLFSKTKVIKGNGFNPVWEENILLPFDCVGGQEMMDLIFIKFVVRDEYTEKELGIFCTSLRSLENGECLGSQPGVLKIIG